MKEKLDTKETITTEELDKVSGGTDFGPGDKCPICGSTDIGLILYARLHHCNNCGHEYD